MAMRTNRPRESQRMILVLNGSMSLTWIECHFRLTMAPTFGWTIFREGSLKTTRSGSNTWRSMEEAGGV